MLSFAGTPAQAQFAGGNGSSGNPYQIETPAQLNEIRNNLSAHYILTADIDLTEATGDLSGAYWNGGHGWEPIGETGNTFTGSFNGDGYNITGLFIHRPNQDGVGLFGQAGGSGEISHIQITDVNITGHNSVGGLVGRNFQTITNSYVTGSVSGNFYVGGLVGEMGSGSVTNSYATGSVDGSSQIGGLVGHTVSLGMVIQSYSTGRVDGSSNYVGGLVGQNDGQITNSYATGSVSGSSRVGGLVGGNSFFGSVTAGYATGNVSGSSRVGGLVGDNFGTVTSSYWNTETGGPDNGNGTGLTSEQMRQAASFNGFNFNDTWQILEEFAFPVLQDNPQDPPPGLIPPHAPDAAAPADGAHDVALQPLLEWEPASVNSQAVTDSYDLEVSLNSDFSSPLIDQTGMAGTSFSGLTNLDPGTTVYWRVRGVNDITGAGDWGEFSFTTTHFTAGDGTVGSPYQIANAEQLNAVRYILDAHYTLIADIDLTNATGDPSGTYWSGGAGWNAIATIGNPFTGSINGDGHTITGLFINRPANSNNALIRRVGNAGTVEDIHLVEVDITGNNVNGGLVAYNDGTITRSSSAGSVSGSGDNIGGLAGRNDGSITNSYATGSVSGSNKVGGLVGWNRGPVTNSYAAGSVSGSGNIGGLVGLNENTIAGSYAAGSVNGDSDIGGFVGWNSGGTINQSYWNTETGGPNNGFGTNLTSEQMRQATSFTGFNFDDDWQILEEFAFPMLQDNPQDPPPGLIPPHAPDAAAPADGAHDVALQPLLEWEPASVNSQAVTDSYDLEVSLNSDYSSPLTDQTGIAGVSFQIPVSLDPGTTVYWRLRGVNISGSGDWGGFSFTTTPDVSDVVILLSPADETVDAPLQPEFTWQEDENAYSYTLLVSLNEDLSDPLIEQSGLTETSVTPNEDLARAATYYWGVFATNPAGDGELSEVFSFTTIPEIPGAVTLLSPADEAVNIALQPTLAWETLAGAEHYQLMVSANSDFSDPVVDENDLSETDYTIGDDLSRDQTYFWRGRGVNPGGEGDWSDVFAFTTIPALSDVAILLSPANGADDVGLAPQLAWNPAAGAISYDLQLSLSSDFSDLVADESAIEQSDFHLPDALDPATLYHWRVRGVNEGGPGDWSDAFTFTTRSLPEGGNRRVLAGNATPYTFSGADFDQTEPTYSIRIESVAGGGTLSAAAADEFTVEQINDGVLTYSGPADQHGYGFASFAFTIIDDLGLESEDTFTMAIDLAAASLELTGGPGWRFLTSPALGETIGGFLAPVWTQGFPGSDNPAASFSNVQVLDQDAYAWNSDVSADDAFTRGLGFIAYIFDDHNNDASEVGFPRTLHSMGLWAPLADLFEYSSLGYDPGQGPEGDSHFLLANPHPVSLDFCEMFGAATNIASSIDVWDSAANSGHGDYINLNCAAGDAVHIAPYQGFWVRTTQENPSLSIPEEAYLSSPAGGFFKERSAMSGKDIADLGQNQEDLTGLANLSGLALTVQSADGIFTNTARILFHDQATETMDAFDAPKLSPAGLAQRWLSFHALDEDGRGYALRSLPLPGQEQVSIPMDIQATEAGSYTVTWNLPENTGFPGKYYLRDTHTGALTELHQGSSYRFDIEESMAAKWAAGSLPGGVNPGAGVVHSSVHGVWADEARFELILSEQALEEQNNLPTSIALAQNYPNPFNPSTIIAYELPQAEHVRLQVYDMTGRQVATLVDGQVPAGSHTVTFEAGNLSSGVYIYRLQAGGQLLTRQLTLIK